MKKTIVVLALVVVVATAAGVAGWSLRSRVEEQTIHRMHLLHDLRMVGLFAGLLGSLGPDDSSRARETLEMHMKSSLMGAYLRMKAGYEIDGPIRRLREGVRRAAVYADRDASSPKVRQRAEELLRQLDSSRGHDAS